MQRGIKLKMKLFVNKNLKNKKLKEAAKKVRKNIDNHFKKDKWDLDYSFQVDEVFYEAYGEFISSHLLDALATKTGKYSLAMTETGLVIRLAKK